MVLRCKTLLRAAILTLTLVIIGRYYIDLTWLLESCNWFKRERLPARGLHESLFLADGQCRAAFPELMNEVDRAVARGPFIFEKEPEHITGLIQARIQGGKLYIITADKSPAQYERRTAILNQLQKALVTSPSPLPDTILPISIIDNPQEKFWSFSRPNDPQEERGNYWVMPHFSFWSWPKPFIGSIDEALETIEKIESAVPWGEKIAKAVWRGTARFNSVANLNLRWNLIEATKGRRWADVEDLEWNTNSENAGNAIRIEDFCKYKYTIYTEGVTYSGRLPFHQACESVILTPPLNYLMHTTHLMRPLFSSSLPFHHLSKSSTKHDPRWPLSYSPSEANVVFVSPDWSDLEQTVAWLESNPEISKGIAKRQRDLNAAAGYLSPAAEVCYWRSLIRGWNKVARPGKSWDEAGDGMRWETFSLTARTSWI